MRTPLCLSLIIRPMNSNRSQNLADAYQDLELLSSLMLFDAVFSPHRYTLCLSDRRKTTPEQCLRARSFLLFTATRENKGRPSWHGNLALQHSLDG